MRKFLAIFVMIFIIGCAKNHQGSLHEILISSQGKIVRLNVEIADDNQERMNGLMFRKNLDENSGMLFVFDNEESQIFWMKDTLIPLDMIFIGKDLKIINIEHALPCGKEPCPLYKSQAPSKYVLEVNSGFSAKNNLKAGDKITV